MPAIKQSIKSLPPVEAKDVIFTYTDPITNVEDTFVLRHQIFYNDLKSLQENVPESIRSRPRDRKKTANVPRPMNCFLLFRQWVTKELINKYVPHANQRDVSTRIAKWWKVVKAEIGETFWKKLADDAKVSHHKLYPDYKYQPKKKGSKKRELEDDDDEEYKAPKKVRQEAAFPNNMVPMYYSSPYQYYESTPSMAMYNAASYSPPNHYLPSGYSMVPPLPSNSAMPLNSEDMLYAQYPSMPAYEENSTAAAYPDNTPSLDSTASFSPESANEDYQSNEPSLFYALPTQQQALYIDPHHTTASYNAPSSEEDCPDRSWSFASDSTVGIEQLPAVSQIDHQAIHKEKYENFSEDRSQQFAHLLSSYGSEW